MTALYRHSTSDLESQFGSPYGYNHSISTGHVREEMAHRSRSSPSPFCAKFDMSPTSVSMAPNFSTDSFSDSDIIAAASDWNTAFIFNNAINNIDDTSPMSNQNFDDFVPNWPSVNHYSTEASQALNIPASQPQQANNNNYDFGFAQHQFANPQQALNSKATTSLILSRRHELTLLQ